MKRLSVTFIAAIAASLSLFAGDNLSYPDGRKDALLFYLSGESINADVAGGQASPNILDRVSLVDDGVSGKAVRAHYRNAYSYLAPGNIYSERGTVAFWWRSNEPLTSTEFPLWRVSFADHTSWDMVWMRIDWNGHGLDAFVTDNNLARVRVSSKTKTPASDEWIHVAFSWDECKGVKLYLNGKTVAQKDSVVTLSTGLDQFGPHQRIVSPYQVQSAYIVQRGGDLDELRIYDHQLEDAQIEDIAQCCYKAIAAVDSAPHMDSWARYYGFDGQMPPALNPGSTSIRKVQINDCYDYKRWYWKACDGLKETTWPGVYNRSRIVGRNDYFQLPDWDCYSFSGTDVRFVIPEKWNHVEITGGAFGKLSSDGYQAYKQKGSQKAVFRTDSVQPPGEVLFTNDVQETPIQEFNAYMVQEGDASAGLLTLSYCLQDFDAQSNPILEEEREYISGRYPEGERAMLLAGTWDKDQPSLTSTVGNSPIVHIVIPSDCKELDYNKPVELAPVESVAKEFGKTSSWTVRREECSWKMLHAGLDGIRVSLPAMPQAVDEPVAMNIAVMDPLQPMRYMFDFTFSVNDADEHALWLDLRDRILPEDRPLYLTVSCSDSSFNAASLQGTRIDLVFKDYDLAVAEHVTDRFNQIRDNHGTLVEESTKSRRYSKFRQLERDMADLLKVDPHHKLGLYYRSVYYPFTTLLDDKEYVAPEGVPMWAYLQLELLRHLEYCGRWYLDNRQAPNGEFGGGISDDSTFSQVYAALAEMGALRERSIEALERLSQAVVDNKTVTGGVSTIQTDGLHSYEEGENVRCQLASVDPSKALTRKRLLESSRGTRRVYMGINKNGHLLFKGDYFGANRVSLDGYWAWSVGRTCFHLCSPVLSYELYGDKFSRDYVLQYVNDLLKLSVNDSQRGLLVPPEVNFNTSEARLHDKASNFNAILLAYAWRWTGDQKYLQAADYTTPKFKTPSKEQIVSDYMGLLRYADYNDWYCTHGSPYIDRTTCRKYYLADHIRLGGQSIQDNMPWNMVAWQFSDEQDALKVAMCVNYDIRDDWFDVEFFNTSDRPVQLDMVGRRAKDGRWEMSIGGDAGSESSVSSEKVSFGRGKHISLTIPAGESYIVKMRVDC